MSSYSLPTRWAPDPVDGMPSSKPPSWRYGNWRTLERGNHERDMRLCGHYWPTQCRQVDVDEPDPRPENLDHFTPAPDHAAPGNGNQDRRPGAVHLCGYTGYPYPGARPQQGDQPLHEPCGYPGPA